MNTVFIVNAIISISLDVMFILFVSSKGFELLWNMVGKNPDEFRENSHKPKNAIANGMVATIPILNAILLLTYIFAYVVSNKIKGS